MNSLAEMIVRFGQQVGWLLFSRVYKWPRTASIAARPVPKPEQGAGGMCLPQRDIAGSLSVIASAEQGKIGSAYSSRFVAVPLRDFCASLKGKRRDDIGDQELVEMTSQLGSGMVYNGEQHRNVLFERFIKLYEKREAEEISDTDAGPGIELLKEESLHHKHLVGTSFWVFSHALTLFYRFAAAYMCLRREQAVPIKHLLEDASFVAVSRFLLNSYLIRTYVRLKSIPIIEGRAHFNDSEEMVSRIYGGAVADTAKLFYSVHLAYARKFGEKAVDYVDAAVRFALDIPFVAHAELLRDFSYRNCISYFDQHPEIDPRNRLERVVDVLEDASLDKPLDAKRLLIADLGVATFENNLAAGLAWYATQECLPPQLVWFVLLKLGPSRYVLEVLGPLVWDWVRGGHRIQTFAYPKFPAMRINGMKGEAIILDPAMGIFSGKSFARAVGGFEMGFAGADEEYYNLVKLQAALLDALSAKFFNYFGPRYEKYREFMLEWCPSLWQQVSSIQGWLQTVDDMTDKMAKHMRQLEDHGQDPVDTTLVELFEETFSELSQIVRGYNDALQKAIYMYGDALYAHGF